METVTIKVSGMTCGGCVARVKRVVQQVAGIDSVDVSLDKGEAGEGGNFSVITRVIRGGNGCGRSFGQRIFPDNAFGAKR